MIPPKIDAGAPAGLKPHEKQRELRFCLPVHRLLLAYVDGACWGSAAAHHFRAAV